MMQSMTPTRGNRLKICSCTTTRIPPTELSRIGRIKSSPETIAALLNKAETLYFSLQKKLHGNVKRVYPFWKICQTCSAIFPCLTKEQALRNRYCSRPCIQWKPRKKRALQDRPGMVEIQCSVCSKKRWRFKSQVKHIKSPVCSYQCNGKLRGKELVKHAYRGGRSGWTAESRASCKKKMSGPNNPAWKGGVTYFRKHGNYKPIKYVRCPPDFLKMARKDVYVMEHRLIVAQAMGRCLKRTEVVHHVNHDPQDNRLKNLELFSSNRDHKLYEAHGTPDPIWRGSNQSTTSVKSGA